MTIRQYDVFRRGFYDGINGVPQRSQGQHYLNGWRYGQRSRREGQR